MIRKRGTAFTEEKFDRIFGVLSMDIDHNNEASNSFKRFFIVIICLRKMSFTATIVFLYNYTNLGILFLTVQSVLIASLICLKKPYQRISFNIKIILQEITFLILNIMILLLPNNENSPDFYAVAGWVMIAFCMLLIFYNLCLLLYDEARAIIKMCRVAWMKLKSRRSEKRIEKIASTASELGMMDVRQRTTNRRRLKVRRTRVART